MANYIRTTLSEICDYWSKHSIDELGNDCEGSLIDFDAPACFICGKEQNLERAHIIPDSLGGKDEPSNLMCLCSTCHKKAPNTSDAKAFLRYIRNSIIEFEDTHVLGFPKWWVNNLTNLIESHQLDVFKNMSVDDIRSIITTPIAEDLVVTHHFGDDVNEASKYAIYENRLLQYVKQHKVS